MLIPLRAMLGDAAVTTIVRRIQSRLAHHETPRLAVTDNGPQFKRGEFRGIVQLYDFSSSPKHPQGSGLAECGAGIVKTLLIMERRKDV